MSRDNSQPRKVEGDRKYSREGTENAQCPTSVHVSCPGRWESGKVVGRGRRMWAGREFSFMECLG